MLHCSSSTCGAWSLSMRTFVSNISCGYLCLKLCNTPLLTHHSEYNCLVGCPRRISQLSRVSTARNCKFCLAGLQRQAKGFYIGSTPTAVCKCSPLVQLTSACYRVLCRLYFGHCTTRARFVAVRQRHGQGRHCRRH